MCSTVRLQDMDYLNKLSPTMNHNSFIGVWKENWIKYIRTSPYHLASNGKAERFVQTFKHSLKVSKNDSGLLSTKLSRFLITYSNTPKQYVLPVCHQLTLIVNSKNLILDNLSWWEALEMVQSGYLVPMTERTGPVSYRVQVSDLVWRCHTDQLLCSQSECYWDRSFIIWCEFTTDLTEWTL